MKWFVALLAILASSLTLAVVPEADGLRGDKISSGGAASNSPEQSPIMDEFERSVVLPARARPIGEYARYYAYGPRNTVIGFYRLPKFMKNDQSRNCLVDDGSTPLDQDAAPKFVSCASDLSIIGADERRWFADWRMTLPQMVDAPPCGEIVIVYDPAQKKFEAADCLSDHWMH